MMMLFIYVGYVNLCDIYWYIESVFEFMVIVGSCFEDVVIVGGDFDD